MKRAAIVVLAIATLVLLGSLSAPLPADSSPYITKSGTGLGVGTPTGGGTTSGAPQGSGNGGTDQGDADGLSGMKIVPDGRRALGSQTATERIAISVEMWWRFMLWIR
jgi:hypothetical protein